MMGQGRHEPLGSAGPRSDRRRPGQHLGKGERMERSESVWGWGLRVVRWGAVALLMGASPTWAQEDPCAGFSGTCYGQCQAALDQGCFDDPDTRKCGRREAQWSHHDCPGMPPWVPATCPCEGLGQPFPGVQWSEAFVGSSCGPLPGGLFLSGRAPNGTVGVLEARASFDGALSCGVVVSDVGRVDGRTGLSEEAFAACITSLRQIAEQDGIGIDCPPVP
jgi:hypothetical protein